MSFAEVKLKTCIRFHWINLATLPFSPLNAKQRKIKSRPALPGWVNWKPFLFPSHFADRNKLSAKLQFSQVKRNTSERLRWAPCEVSLDEVITLSLRCATHSTLPSRLSGTLFAFLYRRAQIIEKKPLVAGLSNPPSKANLSSGAK